MSLATRCPACSTVFRVVRDQLRVSDGWVRCGQCQEVFNAVESLFELSAEPAAPPTAAERPAPPPMPSVPSSAPASALAPGDVDLSDIGSVGEQAVAAPPAEGPPESQEDPGPSAEAFAAPARESRPDPELPVEPPAAPPAVQWRAPPDEPALEDPAEPALPQAADVAAPPPLPSAAPPPDEPAAAMAASVPLEAPDAAGLPAEDHGPAPAPAVQPSLLPDEHVADAPGPLPPAQDGPDAAPAIATRSGSETVGPEALTQSAAFAEPLGQPAASEATEPREAAEAPEVPQELRASESPETDAAPPTPGSALPQPTREWQRKSPRLPRGSSPSGSDPLPTAGTPRKRRKPAFMRRAEREAQWQRPAVRAVLATAVALLALMLAAQAALQFRDTLAAHWPSTRPALARACASFGCQLAAPRALDRLRLESSKLTSGDARGEAAAPSPGPLRLVAELRNTAPHTVLAPAVELSLTDPMGELLARRVFTPAELGLATGELAAESTWAVDVRLDVGTLSVAGFSVEVFYP